MCGVLAGVIYALLNVHSPAPPVVALLGLFGMLVGEQLIPVGRRILNREPLTLAVSSRVCAENQRHGASRAREGKPRRLMIFEE